MKAFSAVLVSGLALAVTNTAHACFVPPDHMYISHEDAIAQAEWIARVRASRGPNGGHGILQVLEFIKGAGPEQIVLPEPPASFEERMALWGSDAGWVEAANARVESGPPRYPRHGRGARTANFYAHASSTFWTQGGHSYNSTDCRIHPRFTPGAEYLVFGPLDYNVGFESLSGDDDAWLSFVRETVSNGQAEAPFPVPLSTYFDGADAVIRVQARLEDGELSVIETVLSGTQDSYLETLFILPEAELADQLRCRARSEFSWRRKDIDRLYIIEQPAANDDWSYGVLRCSRGSPARDELSIGLEETVELQARGRFARERMTVFDIDEDGEIDWTGAPRHRHLFTAPHDRGDLGISLAEIENLLGEDE